MSMLDDILDHLIGTTNQAPPGAKPDKAMGLAYTNPKKHNWERKGKGDKIPRMNVMKPVERDMGIQIAKLKPTPAGGSRLVSSAEPSYGQRTDGTQKGEGYFGKMPYTGPGAKPGTFSTELSVEYDGKLMPSMVPGMSQDELETLTSGGDITPQMKSKIFSNYDNRMAEGKSPFAEKGEQKLPPKPAAVEHHVRHRELLDLFKTLGGGERVQP